MKAMNRLFPRHTQNAIQSVALDLVHILDTENIAYAASVRLSLDKYTENLAFNT